MKKYIVDYENSIDNVNYRDTVINVKKVQEYLEEKFSKTFNHTFIADDEWSMFFTDYEKNSPNLEFLAPVAEYAADKVVVYGRDNDEKRIEEAMANSIFYYPEYEVAVAGIYSYTNAGPRKTDYVFYSNEDKYFKFIDEAQRRYKVVEEKEIIVYTDTSDGVSIDRVTVDELIDRTQVVLEKKVKDDIYDSIDHFFKENKDFYGKYNISHRRGILLYGEPGNGKTTLIKSLVGSIGSPVVYWQVNEYTGSSSIKQVFDAAANIAPVVLVIEDLDSMPQHARSTFLNTLDGATTKQGIYLIGTTNYPERIDKALINRVGRFDRTYEIKLPTPELRVEYLKMRGMLDFVSETELDVIRDKTDNFSFVQLSEVFRKVAFDKFNDKEIDFVEIIDALKDNNAKANTNNWKSDTKSPLGFSN